MWFLILLKIKDQLFTKDCHEQKGEGSNRQQYDIPILLCTEI